MLVCDGDGGLTLKTRGDLDGTFSARNTRKRRRRWRSCGKALSSMRWRGSFRRIRLGRVCELLFYLALLRSSSAHPDPVFDLPTLSQSSTP